MDSAKNPKNIIFEYEMRYYTYLVLSAICREVLQTVFCHCFELIEMGVHAKKIVFILVGFLIA